MKKKILFIVILFLILLNNKIIFSKLILFGLGKWTNKEITVEKFDISYQKNKISIKNISVMEKNGVNKDLFSAEKVNIIIKPKSLFSRLIIIENLEIQNPVINLKLNISQNKKKIINDSLGLTENLKNKENPKVYPKKIIDINFLILKSSLKNLKFNLEISRFEQIMTINLSDMYFKNFGNEKGYQHYKNVFRIILTDLLFRIPNNRLRRIIQNSFDIN